MMNSKLEKAMNEQIKHELESAHLYLAMSAYFESIGMDGMANWMRVQVKEETEHAMKFYGHIVDRGGRVQLTALAQPKAEWANPIEAWKEADKHEDFITGKINDLVKLAQAEHDFAAIPLLNWFITEQIEEEKNTSAIVSDLEKIGPSGAGLLMLDKQFGKRDGK